MTWRTRPRSEALPGLAWCRGGSGEPLVLLHGVGLRAEAWGAQLEILNTYFSLYAPDLPGHGESNAFAYAQQLTGFSDYIAVAIDRIGVPVLLAGHSLGAMIALDIAIRYPQLCRGVAALNPIYKRTAQAAAAVSKRAQQLSETSVNDPSVTLERWFKPDPQEVPQEAVQDAPQNPFRESELNDAAEACRRWLQSVDPKAYKQAYQVFAAEDGPASSMLAELKCPSLFMTGSCDPNSTPKMTQALAQIAPQGEALVVEGAAHMMPMTHSLQVNSALLNLNDRCQGIHA